MLRIRFSTLADRQRVLEIWAASVDATHDFLSVEDRVAIGAEVAGFLPYVTLWLAVDAQSDRPLGFMLLDGPHMEALFIDPEWRGKGIGQLLVQQALSLHDAITTDVNEQNAQAVGFYEHLGFVATGRSDLDDAGRPYPLIHLRSADPKRGGGPG